MIIEAREYDKILEIGCGIHKIFSQSIAIDKNPKSHATIIRDVAKRGIPFSDSIFDLVIAIEVIERIEHYEDIIFFFNEIHRVLKDGGIFKLTTPNGICGFNHLTHHRVFTVGSFDYLSSQVNDEIKNMRESDGITADFSIGWENNTSEQLEGIFIAHK